MPTELQRERLRADLDADPNALTDAEVDDAFARAETEYPGNASAIEAGARIVAIQQLLSGAAKRVDSRQNASSEQASQLFDHLLRLRLIYVGDLKVALGAAAQWGKLRRKPTRVEEYPHA
jgi:hypothetical protein